MITILWEPWTARIVKTGLGKKYCPELYRFLSVHTMDNLDAQQELEAMDLIKQLPDIIDKSIQEIYKSKLSTLRQREIGRLIHFCEILLIDEPYKYDSLDITLFSQHQYIKEALDQCNTLLNKSEQPTKKKREG